MNNKKDKSKIYDYARVERAKTQRIYLVNRNVENESAIFDVMGSRGIIYKVKLSGSPSCTCPDYETRHSRCKHILFILIRIFNVDDPYQEKFTTKEIKKYIKSYKDNISKLTIKYDDIKQCIDVGAKCVDDDCAICLDQINNGEPYVYCKEYCGRCIHEDCYNMVIKKQTHPKCVYCFNNFIC